MQNNSTVLTSYGRLTNSNKSNPTRHNQNERIRSDEKDDKVETKTYFTPYTYSI